MAGKKVVIEFLGKDKSFGSTADRMGGKSDRLGSRMAKVGKIAALGLGAGALIAGKGLYEMGKAAAEDQQQQALLARQLRASTGATDKQVAGVERYITAMGKQLGVTDDELRPAMARLVRATGDIGKAQDLAGLAMDVSAGSGKSLESVTTALAKAQNGNVSGLARLGIATKDAKGETLSFAEIQQKLANQYVGAAATKADTLSGKMTRLKVVMSEAGETIGAKLLPVVTNLATWFLDKGIPAISNFSNEIRSKLGPVIEWVRGLFSSNTNGMASDVSRNLGAIKSTFQSAVSIIQSLWSMFGSTIVAFAVSSFNNLRTVIGGALQVISGIFKVFSALLKGDWAGVWSGIKQILSGAWAIIRGLVAQGWNMIKAAFRAGGVAIKAIFVGIWSATLSVARSGINSLVNLIRGVPAKLRALGGAFKSAGTALIKTFVNGLSNAGSFISNIAGHIKDAVRGAINAAIGKINSALKINIDWPGPGSFNWQASIPYLAKGGVVKARSGGTLAMIGEGGADEAVVPLSGPNAPDFLSGGGGVTIVVNGALDPVAVAEQVRQMLLKLKRTNGTELGLA